MEKKQILLITYAFPPNISIGARRWAKFSKYLSRKGYIIHVITAKSKWAKGNNWVEDVQHPHIYVHYVNDHQRSWLIEGAVRKNDYLKRLLRKFYILYLEVVSGGLWMDEGRFMKKGVIEKAHELIKIHNIKNVISTGPPFSFNYYSAMLKEDFPDLNIICDFRDSWTDAKSYGYVNIPAYVIKEETKKQRYTFTKSSVMLFTYDAMRIDLKNIYADIPPEKFVWLPHAYDPEDYTQSSARRNQNKLRIIYGGSITTDVCNTTGKMLLNALVALRKKNRDAYKMLEFIFYNENVLFRKMVADRELADIVTVNDFLPEKDFFNEAAEADVLLTILGNDWKDYITSKNISYLGFKKPYLLVSEEGEASRFVIENKFGYVMNGLNAHLILEDVILDFNRGALKFESGNNDKFTYENLAQQLETYFK